MYSIVNGRNARNKTPMFNTMHHPFTNYCTESLQKSEMKLDYENEIFLNNLHLIPDPLMKNLADTLVTSEKPEKVEKKSLETPTMPPEPKEDRVESTLAVFTNFFSGVVNVLGAVFRTRTPDYYDCFDGEIRQGSPRSWHIASSDDKNGKAPDERSSDGLNGVQSDMNNSQTVSSCEEKINQVKCLLSPKPKSSTPNWRRRPKKVFVEPGSVEDSFEDAFSPEDFVTLSDKPYIEYYSPPKYQNLEKVETVSSVTKVEVAPEETTEIMKELSENGPVESTEHSDDSKPEIQSNIEISKTEDSDDKHQLVSSCEDKLSKLKALLKEKRTKKTKESSPDIVQESTPSKVIPISKPVDKHYKNPHRMLDKRRKMKMKRSIQDDVIFANEIDLESPADSPSTPSTLNSDTSLGEYFDEMKGRFRTASTTESEDSFQIVFTEPKRNRKPSDCDSEDSFIVFEDDCYTSNDVFGDSDTDSEVSDSGCSTMTCKLSHSLSRTVSNLTDDTLYESSDEVDCAKVEPAEARGLLMDDTRKSLRKNQPAKKVHFSTEPPTVRVMRVWAFAARQARAGHWERYALDRDRFKRRIADVDMAVSWVLKPQHRSRVMFQRFMPLWNRQKRQEIAEKKEREVEEKRVAAVRKIEEERLEEERVEEEKRMEEERVDEEKRMEEERAEAERVEEERKLELAVNESKNAKSKEGKKVMRRYDRMGKEITQNGDTGDIQKVAVFIKRDSNKCNMANEIDSKNDKESVHRNNSEYLTEITDKLASSKLAQPSNLEMEEVHNGT